MARRLGEGRGVRPARGRDRSLAPPPSFDEIGEEYVPADRRVIAGAQRYLGQSKVLAATSVGGVLSCASLIAVIGFAKSEVAHAAARAGHEGDSASEAFVRIR
jgi:hypothetical protein